MKDKYPYEGELVKGTGGACGFDIVLQKTQKVEPKILSRIDLGLQFREGLPASAFLVLRSAYHYVGLIQTSVGLIDRNFTDKLFLVVYSMKQTGLMLKEGERVAQLVFFNELKPYNVKVLREER
ncbi:hypothetical protein KAT51_00520 [bacterium]|nr:hypothetical protein [bacterium]